MYILPRKRQPVIEPTVQKNPSCLCARFMIGLLYQLRAVAQIMEKNSVSNRIRRYVYIISARLHDLNRGLALL